MWPIPRCATRQDSCRTSDRVILSRSGRVDALKASELLVTRRFDIQHTAARGTIHASWVHMVRVSRVAHSTLRHASGLMPYI